MPVIVTGPSTWPSRRAAGCALSAGTQPRSTRSAVPSGRSSGVSTGGPAGPRWPLAPNSCSRSCRKVPCTSTRRNSHARQSRLRWQQLGRGGEASVALGDQRLLPAQPLDLPGAEPEQYQEAEEGRDRGPEPGRETPARGDDVRRAGTPTWGESAWRRTSGGLCWSAFASECSPARRSIEGRAQGR